MGIKINKILNIFKNSISNMDMISSSQKQAESTPNKVYRIVPDYANIESTNRITANNGTWTADRDGYVQVTISNNGAGHKCYCMINNIMVSLCQVNVAGYASISVHPVAIGDVVNLYRADNAYSDMAFKCYFIPMKIQEFDIES